ncbi:MAG: phosphoenolpyruvate synthase [Bacteroidia bacterium]|nr:phosphoenolpyruvate synthase [Bacteroidia bacterium]
MMKNPYTLPFREIANTDVALVGGKNASLGEMISKLGTKGIRVPDGFATTTDAFRYFLEENHLQEKLSVLLSELDTKTFSNLNAIGEGARSLMRNAKMPELLCKAIAGDYKKLCATKGGLVEVAVRSSASAEDLPTASFAGQHDSFLNVRGEEEVVKAVHRCYISLYNNRAIKYRCDHGFEHLQVALSAGIQHMVRSDLASAGVAFTLEPDSGFRDVIVITGVWGLGENIVQGAVTPDEFHVFKPTLKAGKKAILSKKTGSKAKTLIYAAAGEEAPLVNVETPKDKQVALVLNDEEIETLASWSLTIEEHYQCPMDIEWAKDGRDGLLYIVQARPETVHSQKDPLIMKEFSLKRKGPELVKGNAVGSGIASGKVRILQSPQEAHLLKKGEVLVTDITNPDWDPILKKAAAIVTNKGGRTSHAAIVAREVGAVAVVGAAQATRTLHDGQEVTISCAEGKTGIVYEGLLPWEEKTMDVRTIRMPRTAPMLILGDPEKAWRYSFYPNEGVGLLRLEFIITSSIRIHPMALLRYDELEDEAAKKEIDALTAGYDTRSHFFTEKLAQAVATIGAAFYPKDVIVRMSDFKSNEYANLIGGKQFELKEENPMIGFRGASRYYHERYREAFRLECEAMKMVRDEMGLSNVKLMIPFCRTVEEGKKVLALMESHGLKRGEAGLEIYVMAEIPSNVILAEEFAQVFDGFSIGSNDLTQLTLGLDRDSSLLSDLFDENNAAVKSMIAEVIQKAKKAGRKIGLCGQAPSDFPEFAKFLIDQGIDSISFNPDALLRGIQNMTLAEENKDI